MSQTTTPEAGPLGKVKQWLLAGTAPSKAIEGPYQKSHAHPEHSWWQVMCLTGVDYFSTLGYQPGIAALAAGALSPIATLILVVVTLGGALPIYRFVARESPHGDGSIAMLEHLLTWWKGKLFVLCMLGFAATDFIITITLSAADATAHLIENPFAPGFLHGHEVVLTLILVALLGAIFLKGFKEAVGIAVVLVGVYLVLNAIVVGVGLYQVAIHPHALGDWQTTLWASHGNPLLMVAIAFLLFPKLALGLSGFETGVAVMPLVQGEPGDTEATPVGRIRNTHKLLLTAALIMSVFLLTSSLVTTLLIPADEFRPATDDQPAGKANGRALAYLAHQSLGNVFGTAYDVSTILILWFAGASAMAGLINLVPRYLPRYGMAPEWTRAARPLALIYTAVAFVVTILFRASVDAQGGAYATGVLVLMTSAALAVTIACRQRQARGAAWAFGLITLVFAYTTVANVIERPDGVKIAAFFIAVIVMASVGSRVWRTLELRVERIELDEAAEGFLNSLGQAEIHLLAHDPRKATAASYAATEKRQREDFLIPPEQPVLFLEVSIRDSSDFSDVLRVHGVEVEGHRVLRAQGTAVPNSIAAFLFYLRDRTGKRPSIYFDWGEGNPLLYLIEYVLSGRGDIAPVTRQVVRLAEPDPAKRPAIYVGV